MGVRGLAHCLELNVSCNWETRLPFTVAHVWFKSAQGQFPSFPPFFLNHSPLSTPTVYVNLFYIVCCLCLCVCVCVFFRGASGGRPVSAKRQKGHHGNAWLVASEKLKPARIGNSGVFGRHAHKHNTDQTTAQFVKWRRLYLISAWWWRQHHKFLLLRTSNLVWSLYIKSRGATIRFDNDNYNFIRFTDLKSIHDIFRLNQCDSDEDQGIGAGQVF